MAKKEQTGLTRLSSVLGNVMTRRKSVHDDMVSAILQIADKHKLAPSEMLLALAMASQHLEGSLLDIGMSPAEINAMDSIAEDMLGELGISMGLGDDDDDDSPSEEE